MKRLLFTVILTFSGIFGAFISPFYGVCVYLWFAYMRPQEWIWGAQWFIAMRPSLCLAIAVIIGALAHGEKIFRPNKMSLLILLFWIWFVITYSNAINHSTAYFWFDYFTKLIILGFVLNGMITTKKRLLTAMMVITLTLGFYGAKCGMFGIIHPGAKILQGPGGMLADNNTFALAFNMILPFMYFGGELIVNPRYKKWKIAMKALFFLTILAIVFTYSRGGFVGLCVVMLFINMRSKKKLTGLIFMGLVTGIILFFFIPEEYKERLSTILVDEEMEEEREASSAGRLHFWKIAIAMSNDHPILGVGPGCYSRAYNEYDFSYGLYGGTRAVHNSFFQMLTNNGYPGLILFLTLIFYTFVICAKLRKSAKNNPDLYWIVACANIFEISVIGFCVSGFFLSLCYADLIYHIFFMVGAFQRIANGYLAPKNNVLEKETISVKNNLSTT